MQQTTHKSPNSIISKHNSGSQTLICLGIGEGNSMAARLHHCVDHKAQGCQTVTGNIHGKRRVGTHNSFGKGCSFSADRPACGVTMLMFAFRIRYIRANYVKCSQC